MRTVTTQTFHCSQPTCVFSRDDAATVVRHELEHVPEMKPMTVSLPGLRLTILYFADREALAEHITRYGYERLASESDTSRFKSHWNGAGWYLIPNDVSFRVCVILAEPHIREHLANLQKEREVLDKKIAEIETTIARLFKAPEVSP
jgi:hypothetical protein